MGASYLTITVEQALPKPPDVAAEGKVPGGQLIPCTPQYPEGQALANRTGYRLAFGLQQGSYVTLRRIHLQLPVYVGETGFEKTTQTTKQEKRKETKAGEPPEYEPIESQSISPIGFDSRYEKKVTTYKVKVTGPVVTEEEEMTISRSVLPITVTVVVRLYTPDGVAWTESFEVPVHYAFGAAGAAVGVGLLDSYADLTNPIPIDPGARNFIQVSVFIPSSVKTNTQIGVEINTEKAEAFAGSTGEITLLYDLETGPVGK